MNQAGRRRVVTVMSAASIVSLVFGLSCCSAGNGNERADERMSDVASSSSPTADVEPDDVMVADVAPGLTLEVSADAAVRMPQQDYDGRWVTSYDVADERAPYTVIVEYYEPGVKNASEVLATELETFELQGASEGDIAQTTVQVSGSYEAYRLDWTQRAEVPWSAEDTTEIEVECAAIIFDGQDGYTYAVYTAGDSTSEASLTAVASVIESIEVGQ
ncbi:hypothetical protein [Actinomyces ruminicola]|uniref:hypothetical protein n=1 Tax=Actinomyces ruminicola TaxID=332524 RepID=UPI00115F7EAC|nr:hypothetical protein [Actinomyces ruminicola]